MAELELKPRLTSEAMVPCSLQTNWEPAHHVFKRERDEESCVHLAGILHSCCIENPVLCVIAWLNLKKKTSCKMTYHICKIFNIP